MHIFCVGRLQYITIILFSAPSAPVLTAHPVQPGAPPMQPFYQQAPPHMQPLYPQYQPYQPPVQPVMQPQPEQPQQVQPVESVQPVQPETPEQEAPAQPEIQTPAAGAEPAAAPVQGKEEFHLSGQFETSLGCLYTVALECLGIFY